MRDSRWLASFFALCALGLVFIGALRGPRST